MVALALTWGLALVLVALILPVPHHQTVSMATIGLLALDRDLARVLWDALEDDGHTVTWITFGPDAVRLVAQAALDVLVFDGHEYINTRAFLPDLRAQAPTLPVVVLGPARPREVPAFPKVVKLGQRYDLNRVVDAIQGVLATQPPD